MGSGRNSAYTLRKKGGSRGGTGVGSRRKRPRTDSEPGVGLMMQQGSPTDSGTRVGQSAQQPGASLPSSTVFKQAARSQKMNFIKEHNLGTYFNSVPFNIFDPIDQFYYTSTLHFINEFNGTLQDMIDQFTSRLVTFFSREMVQNRVFSSNLMTFRKQGAKPYPFVLLYLITRHIFTAQGIGFMLSETVQNGATVRNPTMVRYYETTLISTLELLFMNHSGHTQTDALKASLIASKEAHERRRDQAVKAGNYLAAHSLSKHIEKMQRDITTPSEMIRQQNNLFGRQAEEFWNKGPFGSETNNPNYIPWGQTVYDAQDDSSQIADSPDETSYSSGSIPQNRRSASSGSISVPTTPGSEGSITRPMILSPGSSAFTDTSSQSGGDVVHGNFVRSFVQKMTTPILSNNKNIETGGISVKNQLLLHNSQIFQDITKTLMPFLYHMMLSVLLGSEPRELSSISSLRAQLESVSSELMKMYEQYGSIVPAGKIMNLLNLLLYIDADVWKPIINPNGSKPSSLSSFFNASASWANSKMRSVAKHLSSSLNKAVHDSLELQNGMSDQNELQVIVYENQDMPNVAPHYDIRVIGGPLTPSQFFSALASSPAKVYGRPVSARLGVQGPGGWQVIEKGDPQAIPRGVHSSHPWSGPTLPTTKSETPATGVASRTRASLANVMPNLRLPKGPNIGSISKKGVQYLHSTSAKKRYGSVAYVHERSSMDLNRHTVSIVEAGRKALVPSTLASLLDKSAQQYFQASGDLSPGLLTGITNLADQGAGLNPPSVRAI